VTDSQRDWRGDYGELTRLLAPLRRRLWLRESVRLVLRAAFAALVVLLAVATLAVLGLVPAPGAESGLLVLALLVAVAVFAALHPPSLLATARDVDRTGRLADRVGTAVEIAARGGGPSVGVQLADATAHLRRLRAPEAVPLAPTRHEAVLAGAVGLLAVGMVLLAGLGDALPTGLVPFRQALHAAGTALAPAPEEAHAAMPPRGEVDARLAPLFQQLEALRGEEGGLSAEEAAARRAAVAQQFAEMAVASRAQQEALAQLAQSLQNTAAAEVAEALAQADYARAAEALATLGQESDQLSPTSRRQLADALRQAQNNLRQLSPELAERAQRAAQALSGRDYRRTERALGDLAEAIEQAGRGVVPQGDLGMLGEALADSGEDLDAALAALAQASALGTAGSASASGANQGGGQPGTVPGGRGEGPGGRLSAPGSALPLDNLPSLDGLPGAEAPDPDRPSVLSPVSVGATSSAPVAQGGETLRAAAETAPVPTERREVVRGYFGAEGSR
jgi:hypothetical protein